jgi:glycosyltransferase involved in cell wall biosynthesis
MLDRVPVVDVLMPAFNEADSLPFVLRDLPRNLIRQIIVCDNASTDNTASIAKAGGATVVYAPEKGYGSACLSGMEWIKNHPNLQPPDILVFIDSDYSDHPEDLPKVVAPILEQQADLVIGSRTLGNMQPGAMTLPQRLGNWLAPALIRLCFGYRFTDLGPFRAIRWEKLIELQMTDRNFGWTVEMQVKAAKRKLRCAEVPVQYRSRIAGKSKVSGSLRGSTNAAVKIISTIIKHKLPF